MYHANFKCVTYLVWQFTMCVIIVMLQYFSTTDVFSYVEKNCDFWTYTTNLGVQIRLGQGGFVNFCSIFHKMNRCR